jgi:cytidine deaminase
MEVMKVTQAHAQRPQTKYSDLSADTQKLIDAAWSAGKFAWCPYLDFPVGAAILAENEAGERKIFGGCNVMNAAFPTNVCAETTAGVKAVSEGYRTFLQVACVASLDNPGGAPCGQCRQLVREFGSGAIVYIVMDKENNVETWSMDELFPVSFGPDKSGLQRTEKPTG